MKNLMVAMPRLGKLVYEREMQRRKKQEEQELLLMQEKSEAGHVELYQAGKKWGVKVDGLRAVRASRSLVLNVPKP